MNLTDMNAIKENRDKLFDTVDEYFVGFISYLKTLSQHTLNIITIAVLHSTFIPQSIAILNGLTEKVPNIDSVMLIFLALSIMAISAIIKKDMMAIFVHFCGFIANAVVLSMIVFK